MVSVMYIADLIERRVKVRSDINLIDVVFRTVVDLFTYIGSVYVDKIKTCLDMVNMKINLKNKMPKNVIKQAHQV